MKFKVGDLVREVNTPDDCEKLIGDTGRVTCLDPGDRLSVEVDFEKYGDTYWFEESSLELVRARENTNYVVFYDENDHDPMVEFSTLKEVKEWLEEALKDDDIDNYSIRIFSVKSELTFKASVELIEPKAEEKPKAKRGRPRKS